MRRQFQVRLLLPVIIGICIGIIFKHFYDPIPNVLCKPERYQYEKMSKISKVLKRDNVQKIQHVDPVAVKPKSSHFNYDFRPYFVYSELGFKFDVVVGIMTYEQHLTSFALAINNTWSQDLSKVIFFTPYSKDSKFHDRYNVRFNLNVVQLPDIVEGSSPLEFSYRILKYMKDHFSNSYKWFVQTPDDIYIDPKNLMQFLYSLNSSIDAYIGHPVKIKAPSKHDKVVDSSRYYCSQRSAIILSRTTLLKLSVSPNLFNSPFDIALADSIFKDIGIHCRSNGNFQDLFVLDKVKKNQYIKTEYNHQNIIAVSGLTSPRMFYEVTKKKVLYKLQQTKQDVKQLQHIIRSLLPKLPAEVPEKTLHWPIGFPPPFKPATRFEVIKWTYFDDKRFYAFSDGEAVSNDEIYRNDVSEIFETMKYVIHKEHAVSKQYLKLVNGYRRLDPQRGAEYSFDVRKQISNTNKFDIIRMHVLRPFTKVEALTMPAATEQKGIHIVLPVLREDINRYETFLQMYKRVCLQTGENVVLLTVFINIRGGEFEGAESDQFVEPKRLIARYKHSYMWAQLPWLQVGVKQHSPVLIMDIVSMKLPSNALIFLMSLSTEFTINFLNRCRVNVVSGIQVFFPIPFIQYDPKIAFQNKPLLTFVDVHRDNGFWDETSDDTACFNNHDYKNLRMSKSNFLDESSNVEESLLHVFQSSDIQVFRAVDSELRKGYVAPTCVKEDDAQYNQCVRHASRRHASRAQLAYYLFQKKTVL